MNAFDTAFKLIIATEGKYVNHPDDKGGETKYGITLQTARQNGYHGNMKDMTLDQAKAIYKSQYWDMMRLDDIAKLSESIAIELFECGVNMGVLTSSVFLQRALNVIPSIKLEVDGIIGTQTLKTLETVCKLWMSSILKMINSQQCVRYMEIVERNPSQAIFLKGWINKRVSL